MALSDTGSKAAKHRRFTDAASDCESVIGPDVVIRGDIEGTTNMEIRGTLEGNLDLEGFLWLRTGGRITGDLSSSALLVEGDVRGNIRVEGRVELRASSHVEGEIVAAGVAIAEGSFFEGSITMDGVSSSRGNVEFREKRSTESS
jgi:cytoskeletal protein CcmA (bactofilin family)